MQFSSAPFLIIFLPITLFLYKIGIKSQTYRNIILLLSSVIFYSWGEPIFILIILLGIVLNFLFGIIIERTTISSRKKFVLIISLCVNIGVLFVFKYLSFIMRNLSYVFSFSFHEIALPIGISFYTFQIMSYIFDVYYGKVSAQKNIFNLALYITMFPQLIAGPIVRYSLVEQEIKTRNENFQDFSEGITRFIRGLAKKVLIADLLGVIVDKIFLTVEYTSIPILTAWIGAIAYSLEIYYDFSGYSDMAIGLGRMFGFHFQENFNYPYISRSITEFWRRWHISLTQWFRDYVYIPLGGNRVAKQRHIFNLFVVWCLTGIWHGAEWTFIVWGIYYFCLQLIEKETNINEKLPRTVAYIGTIFFVVIGWVIFRASNILIAKKYILCMFGGTLTDETSMVYLKTSIVIFVIAILGIYPIENILKKYLPTLIYKVFDSIWTIIIFLLSLSFIMNGMYSPFVYFNF